MKKKTKKLKKKFSWAFTLIELLMAIVLSAVVAIPLSLLVFQHIDGSFQTEDYTMAMNLARYEMELVKNMNYEIIVSMGSLNYLGYNYDLARSVRFVQGDVFSPESLKEVKVDVMRSGSPDILASLITYIARNVSYGL